MAGQWESKYQWIKQFNLSVLLRQTKYCGALLAFLHMLHYTRAIATLRCQTTETSGNKTLYRQPAARVCCDMLDSHSRTEIRPGRRWIHPA